MSVQRRLDNLERRAPADGGATCETCGHGTGREIMLPLRFEHEPAPPDPFPGGICPACGRPVTVLEWGPLRFDGDRDLSEVKP